MKRFLVTFLLFAGVCTLRAADVVELMEWQLYGPIPYSEATAAAVDAEGAKLCAGESAEVCGFTGQAYTAPSPGRLWFHTIWTNKDITDKLAYAVTEFELPEAGFYRCSLAVDFAVQVFINGEAAYNAEAWSHEMFFPELKAGKNRVVLRSFHPEAEVWGMRLYIHEGPFSKEGALLEQAKLELKTKQYEAVSNFMVSPQTGSTLLRPGALPAPQWKHPEAAAELFGENAVKTAWFDIDMKPTTVAKDGETYYLYIESELADGTPFKRTQMFFASADWSPENYPDFADAHWYVQYAFNEVTENPDKNRFIPGLEALVRFRQEMTPVETVALRPPAKLETPATTLRFGTEAEAGVAPGTAAKLDALSAAVFAQTGFPFHTQAARNGVIFYSKGYGETDGAPHDGTTVCYMASISKFLTTALFARFADQGLMEADEPMSRFMPVLASQDQVMTPRVCFTHVNGISRGLIDSKDIFADHTYAGMLPVTELGATHVYNGNGYNLLGHYMQIASATALPRLFEESYCKPLNITDLTGSYQSGGYTTSSNTLAKFAQLMLNRGAYGDYRFFSEDTYQKMLPVAINQYYPKLRDEVIWGWGLTPMAEDRTLGLIGHGAASGSIFAFDPALDCFIAQSRDTPVHDGGTYVNALYKALAEGCAKR